MEKVYTDENVTLSRDGENYKLDTNHTNASIKKNKQTFNSFEFTVNYTYEGAEYAPFLVLTCWYKEYVKHFRRLTMC